MRKVLVYFLLLFYLPACLSAQVAYMEEKAKVNKIKRSSLYLYGEGIAATVEEATAMAETSLKNAILSEMGENKKLQDSDQILINSIKSILKNPVKAWGYGTGIPVCGEEEFTFIRQGCRIGCFFFDSAFAGKVCD